MINIDTDKTILATKSFWSEIASHDLSTNLFVLFCIAIFLLIVILFFVLPLLFLLNRYLLPFFRKNNQTTQNNFTQINVYHPSKNLIQKKKRPLGPQ